MSLAQTIQMFVQQVSDFAIKFVEATASVGLLSMAFIQTAKDVLPIRRWFQQAWLRKWLRDRVPLLVQSEPGKAGGPVSITLSHDQGPEAVPVDPAVAEQQLIRLAANGDGKAFYNLAIEQLCGQANAALSAALDNPRLNVSLVAIFGANARRQDLELVFNPPVDIRKSRNDLTPDAQRTYDSYVDARNRVTHFVQRAIDAIQIAAGFRWKHLLQLLSIVLSGAIAFFAVKGFSHGFSLLITAILVGVLGGFLAPVTRDLVAALQQLRK